jgi:hypothetical protein
LLHATASVCLPYLANRPDDCGHKHESSDGHPILDADAKYVVPLNQEICPIGHHGAPPENIFFGYFPGAMQLCEMTDCGDPREISFVESVR